MKLIDLTGKRFGRLIVAERVDQRRAINVVWRCICSCGKETFVHGNNLKRGNTKSCGCLRREMVTKHGHFGSPTYLTWKHMINRCYQPSHVSYKNYGGRGIKVCNRWKRNFLNFLADMGERPPGFEIDRRNNNGNYEPGNCKWSTHKENNNNKRNNKNRMNLR